MDPSSDIIHTVDQLYNFSSLASIGYGDTTLASIYHTAASSTLIPAIGDILKLVSFAACVALLLAIFRIQMKMRALNNTSANLEESVVVESFSQVSNQTEEELDSLPEPATGGWLSARWGEISRHMESPKEAEWRFAIIESDKMVDEVLKRAGYPGATLGERLTNMQPGQLETLEGLWYAHKIRNRVAHDIDYFLRYTEAKQVVRFFEATLRELKAL